MEDQPVDIDANTLAAIVQNLSDRVRKGYVLPDVAEKICARLQRGLDENEYADITEGRFLAGKYLAWALTHHMQKVSQDEHLWVKWHRTPLPEHEGQLHQDPGWIAAQRQRAALDNYGFHRVERLPGNVGYADIRSFHRPEWGGDTATAAMNFLAETLALIIDLRRCPGGHPDMVVLVCSYLFGPEPVHLNSIYWRDDDITQQYWTLRDVPGKRFGDKPVYVLTSKETFSGGEEFAYSLQARQRATVVGEPTDGGAHASAYYRLHPHFEASIPVGRAINPVTNDNWQGQGVIPDVKAAREQALKVAYRLALEAVLQSIGQPTSMPPQGLLQEAERALGNMASGGTQPNDDGLAADLESTRL
jgi:hypothetical protein